MVNISFYCRKCKAGSKGFAPIEVSVNVSGDRTLLTLPRKERPEDFKKAMSLKKDSEIRRFCEVVRQNINSYITEGLSTGHCITKEFLVECVKNGGIKIKTVGEVSDEFLGIQENKIGITMGNGQYRKYELNLGLFLDFIGRETPIDKITTAQVTAFIAEMNRNYQSATVKSICVRVKALIAYAVGEGYIKKNPFNMVAVPKSNPREEYLSDEDMEKIRTMNVRSEAIERARDLFLFQCATGISYSDMKNLKAEDFYCDKNGVYSVTKRRCKTSVHYTSVILPEGVEILKKYNFKLPVVSNAKYNLNLLKIEAITDCSTHLHSHLGRKVYATNLLRSGCSMKTVSKALGHSSTQVTEAAYAFLRDRDVVKEVCDKMF